MTDMATRRMYPDFGHAMLLVVVVLATQSGLAMVLAVADLITKVGLLHHPAVLAGVNVTAFGLAILLGLIIGKVPVARAFPIRRLPARLLLPMIISCAGLIIVVSEMDNIFRVWVPMPREILELFAPFYGRTHDPISRFLLLVVVAPVTEELFFRGLILQGFLGRFSAAKAVGLCSMLFAFLHLNPWQFASALALGVLSGWWFVRTRTLVGCVLGHALLNGGVFAGPYLPPIPGLIPQSLDQAVEFQPLWLDLIGLAALVVGVWLFHRLCPAQPALRTEPEMAEPPVLVPPVIPPPH